MSTPVVANPTPKAHQAISISRGDLSGFCVELGDNFRRRGDGYSYFPSVAYFSSAAEVSAWVKRVMSQWEDDPLPGPKAD